MDRIYVAAGEDDVRIVDSDQIVGELPYWLARCEPTEAQILDLSWHPQIARPDGFWPLDREPVAFDPGRQSVTWRYHADPDDRRVAGEAILSDLPLEATEPRVIGKGEFLDLFLSAGVPLAKIREASADERLVDFWFALNNFYSQIRRDHPSTTQGIGAMVALGHVSQAQADAVLARWPVG